MSLWCVRWAICAALTLLSLACQAVSPGPAGESTATMVQVPSATASPTTKPVFSPTAAPAATATPRVLPTTRLLTAIPNLPEFREWVEVNNYALARKAYGIPHPGDNADSREVEEYVSALYSSSRKTPMLVGGQFISGMDWLGVQGHSPVRQEKLGWGPQNVDQELRAGNPPSYLVALSGRFAPQATADIFRQCAQCPADVVKLYQTEGYRGMTLHSWGDGLYLRPFTRLVPPLLNEFGQARPIAMDGSYVYQATEIERVKAMIDLRSDGVRLSQGIETKSLGLDPTFSALADTLDRTKCYSAIMSNVTFSVRSILQFHQLEGGQNPEIGKRLESAPRLRPYEAFAAGIGKDMQGQYIVLVLAHKDSESAQENVKRLTSIIDGGKSLRTGEAWSMHFRTDTVSAEGRLLVAVLRRANENTHWTDWLQSREVLILHE